MRCLDFMKITEILRLKEMNIFTYRDIAQSVGCSKCIRQLKNLSDAH